MTRTSALEASGWGRLDEEWYPHVRSAGRAGTSYEGGGFALTPFYAARGPLWTAAGWKEGHHILFPAGSLAIAVMSEGPVLAGPNHAVLFDPGDQYKTQSISSDADRSVVMTVAPETLRSGSSLPGGGPRLRSRSRFVPLSARAHLVRWALCRYLAAKPRAVPEIVEEACSCILDEVLAAVPRYTNGTRHHAAVDEAQALLLRSFTEPLTLDRMAKQLFISPFHLARLFKAETGYTLHGYMTQLRLRRALELLAQPQLDVNEVRARVGFTTHSHFTESFRRAFGVTPSFVRCIDATRLRALSSNGVKH